MEHPFRKVIECALAADSPGWVLWTTILDRLETMIMKL